jgi:tetratricopeptide (TPR) repeat protein
MKLGDVFSERLTHLMAATAICCVDAASVAPSLVTPEMGGHALVEALVGGAALAYLLARRRGDRFISVLRRCTQQVDDSTDAWIDDEFRGLPDAAAKRDTAIAAIRDVLPLIVPKPEELVAARLSEARVAAYYLDRAAASRPFDFANVRSNDPEDMARRDMARRLFASVVGNAYGVIARQPEFAAEILRQTLSELLQGQDEILQGIARIEALLAQQIRAPAPLAERAAAEVVAAAAEDRRLAEALDCLQHGDVSAAEAMFRAVAEEKAARIESDRRDAAAAYRNLGAIAGIRDPKRALDSYARAVEFDNDDKESLLWLAWLSLDRGALGDAEQNYRRVLVLANGDGDARHSYWAQLGLGDVWVQRGDLGAARREYEVGASVAERLAKSDPDNAGWQRDLSVSTTRSATCWSPRAICPRRCARSATASR